MSFPSHFPPALLRKHISQRTTGSNQNAAKYNSLQRGVFSYPLPSAIPPCFLGTTSGETKKCSAYVKASRALPAARGRASAGKARLQFSRARCQQAERCHGHRDLFAEPQGSAGAAASAGACVCASTPWPLPRSAARSCGARCCSAPGETSTRELLWRSWQCQADGLMAGCLGFVVFLSTRGSHPRHPPPPSAAFLIN